MMANVAGTDILPIYIGKRKRVFLSRQRIVIGDRINVKEYIAGPMPTMQEIEKITELLMEKEKKLEMIFREDTK